MTTVVDEEGEGCALGLPLKVVELSAPASAQCTTR